MKTKTKYIITSIFSVLAVAGLGSLFVALGQKWYDSLEKPTQFIPDFVIPIVWSIIYISLVVILILWLNSQNLPKDVVALLIINGVLNVLWCLVFFTLKGLLLGNIIIVLNSFFGVALINRIAKYKPIYAIILTLYALWLLVATTLNLSVWILN